jgi:FAD/FMN-containing dehydrogenase
MNAADLAQQINGPVLEPADEGYDGAREVFNARFESRPDLIASCGSPSDVASAVRFARSSGAALTVRGGGHSYAGNSSTVGGLLVDLSAMNEVDVDPEARTVTAGPGATWGEVDAATQAHGLATVGATVSVVGVSGFTLGGGTGNLSRAFGMSVDNLLSLDVVTADGEQVRASADENPELFWAMRGAGANFGIATSLTYRLHEVGPQVLTGQIIYPFDEAAEMLRSYRDFMKDAPDTLQCFPFMFRIPPMEPFPEAFHGQPALDFVVFHLDPDAADTIRPLRELGDPILEVVAPAPYTVAQQTFDANLPSGQRYYSKAHDLTELTDEVIATVTRHVPTMTGPLTSAYFEPMGGEIARIDSGEQRRRKPARGRLLVPRPRWMDGVVRRRRCHRVGS